MANAPHLLIFEPDPRGHSGEWIEHILEAARQHPAAPRLTFVVAAQMARRLESAHPRAEGIRFQALDPREQALCMHAKLAVSGMSRWSTMRRHVVGSGATHGFALGLDHMSLPLAMGLGLAGRPLSGILFRPSVHYAVIGPHRPSLKERVRDWRKDLLYRLMLANRAVRTVLSLDPYFPADALCRYGNGAKVVALVDPAFPAPEPRPEECKLASAVPPDRCCFVLFGEITQRKGILTLLESLMGLPSSLAPMAAVLIAGRIDPPLKAAVSAAVDQLARTRPDLWLKIEDRRLSEGEIAAIIRRSDVVLAPYQRFVGSSGILLWAAAAGRPVISQDYGLVGRLVRDHRLGMSVDTSDAPMLTSALALAIEEGSAALGGDAAAMAVYASQQQPAAFANAVLRYALDGCDSIDSASSSAAPAGAYE